MQPAPLAYQTQALPEEMYRTAFETVPEEYLDDMLAVLEAEFRRRAGMDEPDPPS
jgi:hypothetical protein